MSRHFAMLFMPQLLFITPHATPPPGITAMRFVRHYVDFVYFDFRR